MKRSDEDRIKASLVEAFENWWDNGAQATAVRMPYISDELFHRMADAALAVLAVLDDIQDSMVADGLVSPDTF